MQAGQLMLLSSGEYSDYSVRSVVRALKDANMIELAKLHAETWQPNKDDEWEKHATPSTFMAWLVTAGWVEIVECAEYHCGNYGDLEIEKP